MGNKSSAPAAASKDSTINDTNTARPRPIPKNFTLLNGCTTLEQHEECIRHATNTAHGMTGEDGLRALGFEFRFVPCCPAHSLEPHKTCVEINGTTANCDTTTPPLQSSPLEDYQTESGPTTTTMATTTAVSSPFEASRMTKTGSVISSFSSNNSDFNEQYVNHCHQCATRLFHVGESLLKSLACSKSTTKSESGHQSESEYLENDEEERSDSTLTASRVRNSHHHHEVTMITASNRQQFIANGAMYELIANLAQQAAQSKMCTTFDLEWVTVCNESNLGKHVQAMVDRDHRLLLEEGENRIVLQELLGSAADASSNINKEEKKEEEDNDQQQQPTTTTATTPPITNKTKSTLLIATGRGKVRAGIFSRHHLLTAGMEMGTSWHCIREARMRKWGVAIIDPNARGEEVGYESFRRSVSRLFLLGDDSVVNETDSSSSMQPPRRDGNDIRMSSRQSSSLSSSSSQQSHSIYILAHSASGGQLVRHLREDPSLLPSIRAIAFTDSTHNVQWCKHDPILQDFLQRKNCVYLRSNDVRSSQSCVKVSSRGKDIRSISCDCVTCSKSAGMEADTDRFWQHRFGRIRTLWAGTADHALSNWAGHESIWDHFDEHHTASGDDDGVVGEDGGVDSVSL